LCLMPVDFNVRSLELTVSKKEKRKKEKKEREAFSSGKGSTNEWRCNMYSRMKSFELKM
jgi:hypothetical protein